MPTPKRMQRYREVAEKRQQGAIVLEDIHDPHNAEAVFRSCDAFGFQRVCLIFDQEEPFDPRRVGKLTSSSANKWLDFDIYSSTQECLGQLHQEGYEVLATVAAGDSEQLFSAAITEPRVAVVLGNEHRGLSAEAIALADRRLTVPMLGMVRSLNLSVTAAILLYEITRQRHHADFPRYLLTNAEQAGLLQRLSER
ncbi:MAG: RNA methyltransferase [Dehalococcoidia bacterium]|nr:RNA methyltransferase [Dehalococcoidia bacterium]HCV00394.1 RNA methyltransferase [Dehalococcoidia bacterium]